MILLLHIVIALTSLVYTTYLFFMPSRRGLHVSYGLTTATLLTGTYLVVTTQTHILQTCVTGLVYLGTISVGLVSVRSKLAHNHID